MNTLPFWSEAEYDTLDAFLLREDGPENAMCPSMIDGFLAAIVSGPILIMPSEWMRWIWDTENGQDHAGFRSEQEAQTILGLVMAQYNAISHALTHDPEHYEPLLMERPADGDEEPIPIIDEWCVGYDLGIRLDRKAWTPLLVGRPGLLSPIILYGTEDGWDALQKRQPTLDEHRMVTDSLGSIAREVHAFWLANRKAMAAAGQAPVVKRAEPVRRDAPKVGRNDPCPCGSGKKYKQCHGATRFTGARQE